MKLIAWQSMTSRGPGKWSNNHYTEDDKKTLCGRKIPERPFRLEACGSDSCAKCFEKQEQLVPAAKTDEEKIAKFKYVVAELGGTHVVEDGEHRAWWDAYGDHKNLYIAYGKLSNINVWLLNNWLYLKLKV